MSHSRFELNPDGYAFVAPSTGGERGPLLHVAVPPDAVPGDVLVDQQGSTATLYVYLGPGPDVSAPLERTTDPTSPDTGPARWAPVQAQVGSALVPTGTIRIWVPDIAYGFPDMVVTGDGAGIGFMLWLCTSPSIPAGSPDPSAPGTTGWTSVGGNTTTFRIYGSVPTYDDLPPTGSVDGELWYVIDEGSLYSWGTDDVWHNVGYIRGPEGPPGSTGAPGPAGPTGAAGPPGPTGPQGEGIHLSGSVPTSDDLPDDAAPGDSYIVEADGDMYVMGDDGQWYIMETVVGPPGTEGIQGPQGPAGPVTPMVIVEALTPPGSLPNGALYFDLDDTYAGYMNATIIEGTIAPADMVPQTLFYDLDATPPIPPTTGALFYKRGTDGALVAIGGAKGDTGATGPAGATGAQGPQGVPGTGVAAGVIQSTIRSTPDVGFLFLTGQTVANGQTLHPDLWAVIPASWKSGSSIIFPDARGRMLVGDDAGAVFTLGALAGSSSLALTNANLPPHTHAIDHDHASATTSGQSVTHTHSDTPGTARIVVGGSATGVLWNGGTNSNGNFVTTPGASVDHTHTVDLPNFTGSSGNGGFANTALVIPTPPSLVINWQIKT